MCTGHCLASFAFSATFQRHVEMVVGYYVACECPDIEPDCTGLEPGPGTFVLGEVGEITQPFCASVSSLLRRDY